MTNAAPRLTLTTLKTVQDNLAADVRRGLTAPEKWLPCKYFYDGAGMALFEEICELPEYYLTRTEAAILAAQAPAMVAPCPVGLDLVELGSGSARKTGHLIATCLARQPELTYRPIDIAARTLEDAAQRLLDDFAGLRVAGLVGEYADGLEYLRNLGGPPRLVVFLGSTVGNFNDEEIASFFRLMRRSLRREDRFLLGFDLLKDPARLIAAYDDSRGVTARFNLNVLARVNATLGADFDLTVFRHRAVFDANKSRIEMHLVSTRRQTVRVLALKLEVTFAEGEAIHTENCYKHSEAAMRSMLAAHGFEPVSAFTDPARDFCLYLIR